MKNTITYAAAIEYVLNNYPVPQNIADRLDDLMTAIGKRNASHGSDEARARANEKRKTATAAKRAEFLAVMVPLVREGMTTEPRTDKEIFAAITSTKPEELTLERVRYMLVHNEVGTDIVTVKNGKNPNTYYIKEGA